MGTHEFDQYSKPDLPRYGPYLTIRTNSPLKKEHTFPPREERMYEPLLIENPLEGEPLFVFPRTARMSFTVVSAIYKAYPLDRDGFDTYPSTYTLNRRLFLSNGLSAHLDGGNPIAEGNDFSQAKAEEELQKTASSLSRHTLAANLLPTCYVVENVPINKKSGVIQGIRLNHLSLPLYRISGVDTLYIAEFMDETKKRLVEETGLQENVDEIVGSMNKKVRQKYSEKVITDFGNELFAYIPFDELGSKLANGTYYFSTNAGADLEEVTQSVCGALEVYSPHLAEEARLQNTFADFLTVIPGDVKEKIIDAQLNAQMLNYLNIGSNFITSGDVFLHPNSIRDIDKRIISGALETYFTKRGGLPDLRDRRACADILRVAVQVETGRESQFAARARQAAHALLAA